MSSKNSQNNNNPIKKEKCSHKKIYNPNNKKYSFCQNCGGLIMRENSLNFHISKPLSLEKQLNEDPVELFNIMLKRPPIKKEKIQIQSSYLKKRK